LTRIAVDRESEENLLKCKGIFAQSWLDERDQTVQNQNDNIKGCTAMRNYHTYWGKEALIRLNSSLIIVGNNL
jgi:hypothetical protein